MEINITKARWLIYSWNTFNSLAILIKTIKPGKYSSALLKHADSKYLHFIIYYLYCKSIYHYIGVYLYLLGVIIKDN